MIKPLALFSTFFLISYLFFDLIFGFSGKLEFYIQSLQATLLVALIIILLLISDILIPVPSSLLMIVSGILFGGFWGGIITLTGLMVGSILNFHLSRKFGQVRIRKWIGERDYKRFSSKMQKYGEVLVVLTRMVPIAMESVSSIAGVSKMKFKNFVLANMIGFLPIIFFYSYAGEIYRRDPGNIILVLVIGFFVPLIAWFIIPKLTKI